jgi:hypothetical protein
LWPAYRQLHPAAARLFRLSSVTLCPTVSVAACASLAGFDFRATRRLPNFRRTGRID